MAESSLGTAAGTGSSQVTAGSIRQLLWYMLCALMGFVVLLIVLGQIARTLGSGTGSGMAVDYANNAVTVSISTEPPDLNSTRGTDSVSFMVLGHVMEGLLRYDSSNNLVPGVAESYDIGPTFARFHIREDALWHDGTPVTAHDFVFAWRKGVDPENASQYAFILFPIKNAQRVNSGELPLDQLGAYAADDRILEVELEQPTSYFDKLLAFATYFPINEAFYEAMEGAYAADADKMLYNGPFVIASWAHDANLRLEKNQRYWNRGAVQLDTINYGYMVSDQSTNLNLFEAGNVVMASLNSENIERALRNRWDIKEHSAGAVYYLSMNHREERLLANDNLRQALKYANDPDELVYKVIKLPGYRPGYSLFPVWLKGVEGYFRTEYPAPKHVPNRELAREYLARGLDELGLDELPPMFMLVGDSEFSRKQAEYYQNRFKEQLGIEVKIDAQTFKQRLAKMTAGDFDLCAAGWGPDYSDPLTFGDLFTSWNENNRGRYSNPDLDEQVLIAMSSLDPVTRMEAFDRVQHILYDDAAILMNYESGIVYVTDPRVNGIVRRAVGTDPDYSFAWLDPERKGS